MRYIIIYAVLGFMIFGGCRRPETPSPPVPHDEVVEEVTPPPPQLPPEPTYRYRAGGRRDPFRALVSEEIEPVEKERPIFVAKREKVPKEVKGVGIFDLDSLRLSGLIWDREEALALLHDKEGNPYILKRGRLLDPNSKPIEGVFGRIREDGVYLKGWGKDVRLTLGRGGIIE